MRPSVEIGARVLLLVALSTPVTIFLPGHLLSVQSGVFSTEMLRALGGIADGSGTFSIDPCSRNALRRAERIFVAIRGLRIIPRKLSTADLPAVWVCPGDGAASGERTRYRRALSSSVPSAALNLLVKLAVAALATPSALTLSWPSWAVLRPSGPLSQR